MIGIRAALAVLLLSSFLLAAGAPKVTLQAGDPAPALSVSKWLKGKAVPKLEKGTVYVVEFWATWCPPCRESIPHITQLQKQYPDIVFIGVNAFERSAGAAAPFVKEMGDRMDYHVAVDTGRMAKTWMDAAGQDGIPCAFVVDKEGTIAWIGNPGNLDNVLKNMAAEGAPDDGKSGVRVGSPAPPLKPGKWVKGEPVEAFEAGKVYVIEFWATWCPPCKESIPHVTALQKKYPAVTFIGQDIGERDPNAPEPFVREMGAKMDYRVALDDNNSMAKNWLEAAGVNGIPTAFIINRDSRIAWIGHPMELDGILPRYAREPKPTTKPAAK